MIRALQPTDLPRWLLMGQAGRRNRVFTRSSLSYALPSLIGLTGDSFRALSKSGSATGMSVTPSWRSRLARNNTPPPPRLGGRPLDTMDTLDTTFGLNVYGAL